MCVCVCVCERERPQRDRNYQALKKNTIKKKPHTHTQITMNGMASSYTQPLTKCP